MTDCKNFPDHLIYSSQKNGRQQEFDPANSCCDTNPLSKNSLLAKADNRLNS
jgi:hypothetical protein